MEDEFSLIIDSLGNLALSWVPDVQAIRIYPDPVQGVACMEVCLRHDTWEQRERAVDKLVELRSMFIDDLSLSYRFTDGACECVTDAPGARQYA